MFKRIGITLTSIAVVSVSALFLSSNTGVSAEDNIDVQTFNETIARLENEIQTLKTENEQLKADVLANGEEIITISSKVTSNTSDILGIKQNNVSINADIKSLETNYTSLSSKVTSNTTKANKVEAREDYFYEKTLKHYPEMNIIQYIIDNMK